MIAADIFYRIYLKIEGTEKYCYLFQLMTAFSVLSAFLISFLINNKLAMKI